MDFQLRARVVDVLVAKRKLAHIKGGLDKARLGAVQRTRKKAITWASSKVREHMLIKKKDLDRHFTNNSRPTKKKPIVKMSIKKQWRPSLKAFGLKSITRKARKTGWITGHGVSYRISRKRGRQIVKDAFGAEESIYPKLHGHAFRRVGQEREPTVKLHGPSPWGVFMKRGLDGIWAAYCNTELRKELYSYVRYLLLKAEGKA